MSRPPAPPWSVPVRLDEVPRATAPRRLIPDEATRGRIARALGLAGLPLFEAEVRLAPWHDGAEIQGRWRAVVTYVCGVSLEPFDAELADEFVVRAVPAGSPLAVAPEPDPEGEIALDPDAEDPPDVLDGAMLDLGAYLVEHLALELDPFPRRPGAVFEPPPPENPESPFAVLKRLKE